MRRVALALCMLILPRLCYAQSGGYTAPLGTVNGASQYDVPYYSSAGTTNALSGAAISGLQLDSTSGAPTTYGGTTCAANTALTALSASGGQTCGSFVNAAGQGLSISTHTLSSNAEWDYSGRIFQSASFANNTIADCTKVLVASTIDNCTAMVQSQSCTTAQTFGVVDCGSSTTCASPVTKCSVQVTAAVTAFNATVASAAISAGDYICAVSTAGSCSLISTGSIRAQIHSN